MVRRLRGQHDIAVIGGGMAGLAAAHYAVRCGRAVILFEGGGYFGGQIANVKHVEGLSVPGDFSGQHIANRLVDECRALGVEFIDMPAQSLTFGDGCEIVDETGKNHRAKAVVLASGARPKTLGVAGEEQFTGRGISRCAACDGPLYRSEEVVVVGGGDGALHEALDLVAHCSKVTIVCRGDLHAKQQYVERLSQLPNVEFIWNAEVEAIEGDKAVTGVRLRNLSNQTNRLLPCTGVFVSIGSLPNSQLLPSDMQDAAGLVLTGEDLATRAPGVFAAGAVRAGYGGQIAQALAEGVSAAQGAILFAEQGTAARPARAAAG